ncbi:MAG: sodium:solute symporter [Verrucomicrobia subdivision 3 bacterium]|nr:sodium:solute symporter [Limisphaerales bacterium]
MPAISDNSGMSPGLILACIGGYFAFLLLIAWYTSRHATNESYFLGNRASPWYAVAFGLIGDSLSGVTFISVPGQVGKANFSYLQVVFGYVVGYLVIAGILLPLYYRLRLTSIYTYLRDRFGPSSQKTGAFFFLVSRTIGAAARLYLTASVIQLFVFDRWGIHFVTTVATIIGLILLYTYKGGIKTLVWTDTFQSSFLLAGLVLSVVAVARQMDWGVVDLFNAVAHSPHSKVFVSDWKHPNFVLKDFLGGAAIAMAMTGLDQNMMQKNLSCRSLGEAQKNIYSFSIVVVFVNLLFVSLGAFLYSYSSAKSLAVPKLTDHLFPTLALQHLGTFAAVAFVIGLTAATFSSADSVLTTLTTSFCVDFLGTERPGKFTEQQKTWSRHAAHIGFSVLLLAVILAFWAVNEEALIGAVLKIAGYTYGPLLGLFAFGICCKTRVHDPWVPLVCVVTPALCYVLSRNGSKWLGGYGIGYELLILNGLLTALGLFLCRRKVGGDPVDLLHSSALQER